MKEHEMTETIDPIEYGRLLAQVSHLTAKVDKMEENVQAMRDLMEQSRGGWRTLVWLGGIAGSIGAIAAWIIAHVKVS